MYLHVMSLYGIFIYLFIYFILFFFFWIDVLPILKLSFWLAACSVLVVVPLL